MSDVRLVVEVKWLLAAFPEAEVRHNIVWLNGSAFPVTLLQQDPTVGSWWAGDRWADDIEGA